MPALTGIIINAVGEDCKNMASSFSMFMYNIVGYAMAPLLSGVVSDATKDMVWGWRLIMLMSIPSILCALLAYFAIKSQVEKAEEELKKVKDNRGAYLFYPTLPKGTESVRLAEVRKGIIWSVKTMTWLILLVQLHGR